MNVPADRVRQQITSILTAWGMEAGLVRTTAEVMVETDLSGVDSHGISMLMDYEQSRLKGKLNLQAKPRVVRDSPVIALVDADAGLGHPAALAPKRGLIGFVTSATRTIAVVPTRSKLPVLGTNPIAFAAPTRRNRPF